MDKVLVLKNTKKGLTVDTVYNSQDTIVVQFNTETSVSIPDNTIKVDIPEKAGLDVFASYAAIFGGLAAIIGAFIAFYQLFKRDRNKEAQIAELVNQTTEFSSQTAELIKQTKINEKRLRMLVKPYLWSNGGGNEVDTSYSNNITMSLDNRGELCFYDDYEILEGDELNFQRWNRPIEIEKDKNIKLSAPMAEKSLDNTNFKIKVFYHDQEDFKYEAIFEFKGGATKLLETIEK